MAVALAPRAWTHQPPIAARVRPHLKPVAGIQPGGWGLLDSAGNPLVVDSTISTGTGYYGLGSKSVYDDGGFRAIYRNVVAEAGHPYCFVGVFEHIGADAGATGCVSSLATTGDKTFRVYLSTGACFAQHIGATTNASATTGSFWNFRTPAVVVAAFRSPTSVSCYGRGFVGGSLTYATPGHNTTNVGSVVAPTIFSVNGYKGSVVTAKIGAIVFMAEWMRYLPSDAEIQSWLDNPWSVYEDRKTYDWINQPPAVLTNPGYVTGSITASGFEPEVTLTLP